MARCVIEMLSGEGFELCIEDIGHLFGSTDKDHLWEAGLYQRTGGAFTSTASVGPWRRTCPSRCTTARPGAIELLDAIDALG